MHADEPQPQLTFEPDGDDLLVTARVRANNSPHVLWTRVNVFRGKVVPAGGSMEDARPEHRVTLEYYALQNRDLYKRSFKSVDVTWRLHGHKEGEGTYLVEQVFRPDTAELLELLPRLKDLAEQGQRRTSRYSGPSPDPE